MKHLPEELLCHILEYLDRNPPSLESQSEVPCIESLFASDITLKNLSCVSRAWRRLVIPVLFKHTRIKLTDALPTPHYCPQVQQCRHECQSNIAPEFVSFAKRNALDRMNGTLLVYQPEDSMSIMAQGHRSRWFMWQTLLTALNPRRLILVVPPGTIGAIAGQDLNMTDSWAFKIAYQRLDLAISDASNSEHEKSDNSMPEPQYSPDHPSPFHFKSWDVISSHIGSCLPVFGSYHYFEKVPPCLLTRDHNSPKGGLVCLAGNLAHLTYQAVFPHQLHMRRLALVVWQLEHLKTLTLQLTPSADSNVLNDLELISRGNLNLRDCWAEVERAYYDVISMCLGQDDTRTWQGLQRFTSLDYREGALQQELDRAIASRAPQWIRDGEFSWIPQPGLLVDADVR